MPRKSYFVVTVCFSTDCFERGSIVTASSLTVTSGIMRVKRFQFKAMSYSNNLFKALFR